MCPLFSSRHLFFFFSILSAVLPQRKQLQSDKLFQVSVNSLVRRFWLASRLQVVLPFYLSRLLLSNSKTRHVTAYRRGSTTGPMLLMMDGENRWKAPNKKKRDSNCWVLCQMHCESEATWNQSQKFKKSDENKCGAADVEAHQTRRHSCSSLLPSVG